MSDIIEVETTTYVLEEVIEGEIEILEVENTISEILIVEGSQGLPGTPAFVPEFLSPRVKLQPFSPNMVLDWSDADTIKIILTGDTIIEMTGAVEEQKLLLVVSQDSVGGRTIQFGSEINYSDDLKSIIISNLPNKRDRLGFIKSGPDYDFVAINKGW